MRVVSTEAAPPTSGHRAVPRLESGGASTGLAASLERLLRTEAPQHQIHAFKDTTKAEFFGAQMMSPHRLSAGPSFEAAYYQAPLDSSALIAIGFTAGSRLESVDPDPLHTLTVTLSGKLVVEHYDGSQAIAPAGWVLVTPPAGGYRISFAENTILLGMRIPDELLTRRLAQLTGKRAPRTVTLARTVGPNLGASAIHALLQQAFDVVEQTNRLSLPLLAGLEQMLVTNALFGIPGSHSESLYEPTAPLSARVVKEVAEIIRNNYADCPPLPELADRAGVSLRRLQAGFRSTFGTTPSHFVRDTRLDAAHEMLQRADRRETTVATIATTVGCTHLGRFAASYRERFGVDPSETLRTSDKSAHRG